MLNSKLNLQNNQFQISNHPKIQEAFKLILSELNDKNLKIKELEEQIIILNEKISNITKSKSELEEIILKQEDNIIELNNTINNDYLVIQGHISEINKHEVYINQLLTTIKEQKIQIQNVKELQLKKDKEELIRLKKKIRNLKV